MRVARPHTVRTQEELREVAEFYSSADEFVFDVETVGKRRLQHTTNRVLWLGLCQGPRVDLIPMGHPKGELVKEAWSERIPWWDENDLTKRGKPRKKWRTIRHEAKFTDPPDQLWPEDVWSELEPVFFGDAVKIGHNVKYDTLSVAKYYGGRAPAPPYLDTGILARIVDSSRSSKLKTIVSQMYGHDYDQEDIAKPDKFGENGVEAHPFSKVAKYLALDVRYPWDLSRVFMRLLEKRGDSNVVRLEMDLLESLIPGALLGLRVDEEAITELAHRLTRDHQEVEQEIFRVSGEVWDLNSTPQKQRFVYETRGHKPEVFTGKSCQDHPKDKHHEGCTPSTSEKVIRRYAAKDEAVQLLLEYANVQKLRSTYTGALNPDGSYVCNKQGLPIEGMSGDIVNGRIHPNLNTYGAETNRLSSSGPNLQNIPSRSEDERAKSLRKMFLADSGHLLIVADYSQIEYRVLAFLSEDENLIDAFVRGWDPHASIMASLLGVPIEEVPKKSREAGKTTNFGDIYGAGVPTLAQSAGVSESQIRAIQKENARQYPRIAPWKKEVVAQASRRKPRPYVKTILGHRRWLPGLWSEDFAKRSSAERQCVNTAVQGSAADIIKVAMVRLHRRLPAGSTMLLQVHDELIVQAPEDQAEEVRDLMVTTMSSVRLLGRVPLAVEANIAQSWADAK